MGMGCQSNCNEGSFSGDGMGTMAALVAVPVGWGCGGAGVVCEAGPRYCGFGGGGLALLLSRRVARLSGRWSGGLLRHGIPLMASTKALFYASFAPGNSLTAATTLAENARRFGGGLPMSEVVTVVARGRAKPGQEARVREALTAVLAPTRAEPGCINYDLHVSLSDPRDFLIHENWQSAAALEAHFQTPHIKKLFELLPALVEGQPDITQWKMVR
jgi:quinol monooxygenase YgiN